MTPSNLKELREQLLAQYQWLENTYHGLPDPTSAQDNGDLAYLYRILTDLHRVLYTLNAIESTPFNERYFNDVSDRIQDKIKTDPN